MDNIVVIFSDGDDKFPGKTHAHCKLYASPATDVLWYVAVYMDIGYHASIICRRFYT